MTLIKVSSTGAYTQSAYIKARAFVVLAHAVIEDYLEGICLEVVDQTIKAFSVDDRPRTALLALLRYAAAGAIPDTYKGGPWGLRGSIADSRQVLRRRTEGNHGINEKHVLPLLLTAGLKETDMGTAWLSDMTDLGVMRGRVAHRGYRPGAQTSVDPKDALDQVEKVSATLCRIDAKLVILRDE